MIWLSGTAVRLPPCLCSCDRVNVQIDEALQDVAVKEGLQRSHDASAHCSSLCCLAAYDRSASCEADTQGVNVSIVLRLGLTLAQSALGRCPSQWRRATPRPRPPALRSLSGAWQSAAARWRSPAGTRPHRGSLPCSQGQAVSTPSRYIPS